MGTNKRKIEVERSAPIIPSDELNTLTTYKPVRSIFLLKGMGFTLPSQFIKKFTEFLQKALFPQMMGISIIVVQVLIFIHHLNHRVKAIQLDLRSVIGDIHTNSVAVQIVVFSDESGKIPGCLEMIHEGISP